MGPSGCVLLATAAVVAAAATGGCQARPAQPPPAEASPVTAAAPSATPSARPVPPDPRVGAVFAGTDGTHDCTASVLRSEVADLILTAAHCVTGGGDISFIAGFADGDDAAAGRPVEAVYLDPRWLENQDPAADFAVARVSRGDGPSLRYVAGGGLRLGASPPPGTQVTVVGYAFGVGGGPTACSAATSPARDGYPMVHCDGVVAGFSGAPWISGSTVVGVVGGLDGGGCVDEVSYSPPFDGALAALLARAEAGGPADDPPLAFDDGCD